MLQPYPVAPAKAGVQENKKEKALDTGLRRHDGTSFLVDHFISTALSSRTRPPFGDAMNLGCLEISVL
jgi:hypothetical protein